MRVASRTMRIASPRAGRRAPWPWSRQHHGGLPGRRGAATSGAALVAVAGAGMLAVVARRRGRARAVAALDAGASDRSGVREAAYAVTIGRPVGEVFGFWRDLENLPRVMAHLDRIEVLDDTRSRWVARGPGGRTVTWEAELRAEEPNRLLAWRTLQPATVPHVGRVEFRPAPGDRGTEVRVRIGYVPPAGRLGVALAWLGGHQPDQKVREDLRRLKRVLECGEAIKVDEQPSGRGPLRGRLARATARRLRTGGRP